MIVKEIYDYLNKLCPFDTCMDFDNVGLLIGSMDEEIENAIVTLDCTKDTVALAKKNNAKLIITHHPIIFSGLKVINKDSIVYSLIENGITVISAHTNLDIAHGGVNETLFNTVKLKDMQAVKCDDGAVLLIGKTERPFESGEYAEFLKQTLGFSVRYVGADKKISKVGVCCGGGGEYFYDAVKNECDAFITGEVKHHIFLDAYNLGKSIFDCGHYATEDIIVEPLAKMLKDEFQNIQFITEHSHAIRSL